jgi:type I restriction enzyme S subunit
LAQAIFIDMFGDPVKNEKGWEVKKLEVLSTKSQNGLYITEETI